MGLYLFLQKKRAIPPVFLKSRQQKSRPWNYVHCRLLKATIFNRSFEYFELFPDGDRLCPALHPQLGINIADMTLHGREWR